MNPKLAAIDASLAGIYDPQIIAAQQRMNALPGEFQAGKSALQQAKINAFRDIANNANEKGVLFSGFKPAEEARYTGEKFLPALADLGREQRDRKFSLVDTINKIASERGKLALDLSQTEEDREEKKRQFDAELALAAKSGGGGGSAADEQKVYLKGIGIISDSKNVNEAVSRLQQAGLNPGDWSQEINLKLQASKGYQLARQSRNPLSFLKR